MKLLIAGAGGHGRVVADTAAAADNWNSIAFIDDRYPQQQASGAWPIVGTFAGLQTLRSDFDSFIPAVGRSAVRLELIGRALNAGFNVPVLSHPAASPSPRSLVRAGTVIFAGAVIGVGAEIGVGCIINHGATVDHDCWLGEGVHVCPGAHVAGDVQILACSWIGIGATVMQGIRIGANAIVGAGAVCISDVPDNATVVGVPARSVRK